MKSLVSCSGEFTLVFVIVWEYMRKDALETNTLRNLLCDSTRRESVISKFSWNVWLYCLFDTAAALSCERHLI